MRSVRAPRLSLAPAAFIVVAVVVIAGLVVGWRRWLAPSGEASPIEACADARCEVQVALAVDGKLVGQSLSFVTAADSAVEIDFVFLGLPVAPEKIRLLTPPDQQWLVAEGTLEHPEAWSAGVGEGPAWVDGWDRAGNGAGLLRRWWRGEAEPPGSYALVAPPAIEASGRYVIGSDALLTIADKTPPGTYTLTIEVEGSAGDRPVTAYTELEVGVTPRPRS